MNSAGSIVALVYVLEVLWWLLNLPNLWRGLTLRGASAIRSCGAGEGTGPFVGGIVSCLRAREDTVLALDG